MLSSGAVPDSKRRVPDANDDEVPPKPPRLFRRFLTETFGVMSIPERASDIGIKPFVEYGVTATTYPFALWMNSVTPPPTAEDLAEIDDLMRRAEKIGEGLMQPSLLDRIKGEFGR